MKRINNLILALAGLFAVACADTFEERYDLAVNTDRYSVTAEAGKLPVTVYCSGRGPLNSPPSRRGRRSTARPAAALRPSASITPTTPD